MAPWSQDGRAAYERALGMDRPISRRDFLNGAAIGIGAALGGLSRPAAALSPENFPAPADFDGQTDRGFAVMHALRDGTFWKKTEPPAPTGEHYDLVVVGAGISGLAAAFLFRQLAGPDSRILILENSEDFGGHARRNEFTAANGRRIIGYGGSESLQSPSFFSPAVSRLLADLGIEPRKFETWFDRGWAEARGLGEAAFFTREVFGADALVPVGGKASEWVPRTPLEAAAKRDLTALFEAPADPLRGRRRTEKLAILAETTYEAFLLKMLGLHPQVASYFADSTKAYFGAGIDAVTCLDARAIGNPGFDAMKLGHAVHPTLSPSGRLNQKNPDPYIHHFPDGNASLARALVRALIPGSLPGTMIEDLLPAQTDYGRLDRVENRVRLRLNAPCLRIGEADRWVEAAYAAEGGLRQVTAERAVLACWHRVIPLIMPELSLDQVRALNDQHKVPVVYANVLLRSWAPMAKLGVSRLTIPGGFWEECRIDYPVSIGGYRFAERPDDPILLHLARTVLGGKGCSAREQSRAGRHALTALRFEDMEFQIRDLLARALGPGGFEPARDIEAITINRWSHGYSYEYMRPWDRYWPDGRLPIQSSRRNRGRIAIANADAGAYAYAHSAIDQAARAVYELLGPPPGAPAYATFPGPPLDKIGLG